MRALRIVDTPKKEDGAAAQGFLYAPGLLGPVTELNADGNPETNFIYATRSNVPDYMERSGHKYRLITDQVGSVRMVVDAETGSVEQAIEYDAFGRVLSDSNPGFQPFGFAGGIYDQDTKLTHFGAREYDAELGRWTSMDPISFSGGDSNLYGYVMQDPVNLTDPGGLFWSELGTRYVGFADGFTFGLTDRLRGATFGHGGLDKCSLDYRASKGIGRVTGAVTLGVASGGAAAAAGGGGLLASVGGGAVAGGVENLALNPGNASLKGVLLSAGVSGLTGGVANPIASRFGLSIGHELGLGAAAAAGVSASTGSYSWISPPCGC